MPKALYRDGLASIVVFLVALPLCMGIAIASGAPPTAGLITGMIGGIVVGLIGGSPLQVSGPAAGLAVIVYDLIQRHGFATVGVIVVLAGVVQMIAGARKLGRWFQAVPPAVIYGMLAGIGVLIFGSQFHVMVDDQPRGSGLMNLLTIPVAIYKVFTPTITPHEEAAGIGLATIAIIALWNGPIAKRVRSLAMIPGALVAVLVATIAAQVLRLPIARVAIPENLGASIDIAKPATFAALASPAIIGAALALAVIASAETLLCASAVDRMQTGPRTNYNRELFAQGVGNTLCGLLGGLPMTGVIVRSSANVEAGAKTRWSAVLHGVWLLLLVLLAPFVLRMMPVSSLAGLLVFTGYKLMRQDLAELRRAGRAEVYIFFTTIAGIVILDLLKGVLIGLGIAILRLVWKYSRLRVTVRERDGELHLSLSGVATFLGLPALNEQLAKIPVGRTVHVHLEGLDHADHAARQAIALWQKQYEARDGVVLVNHDELDARAEPAPLRPSHA